MNKMETVTIKKEEYERLKKESKIDWELVEKIKRGLEDIRHGRIKKFNPQFQFSAALSS